MKISELASKTGLSVDTIRFYEKRGLLTEAHFERLPNNYRRYKQRAVNRLRLIGWGKMLGFTLAEIERTIEQWESDELTDADKAMLLHSKLAEVDARITDLYRLRLYIETKLALVEDGNHQSWEQLVAGLQHTDAAD